MSAQSPCPHCAGSHAARVLEELSAIPSFAELLKGISTELPQKSVPIREHALNAAQMSLHEAQQVLDMFTTAFEAGDVSSGQQGAVLYVVQRLLSEVSVALDQRGGV